MRVVVGALFAAGSLVACGVEHLRPPSPSELSAGPDVIAFAKQRYTSFRASMGLAQWGQTVAGSREKAIFRIVTNRTGWDDDYVAFNTEMRKFCEAKGGRIDGFNEVLSARIQSLLPQYTRTTEANAYGGSVGTAAFECGPPGRGSVHDDWSQFNEQHCRRLYTTVRDYDAIRRQLGNPPDYGCVTGQGALFLVTVRQEFEGADAVSLRVRLQQGIGGAPIGYTGYPQMN